MSKDVITVSAAQQAEREKNPHTSALELEAIPTMTTVGVKDEPLVVEGTIELEGTGVDTMMVVRFPYTSVVRGMQPRAYLKKAKKDGDPPVAGTAYGFALKAQGIVGNHHFTLQTGSNRFPKDVLLASQTKIGGGF